MIKDFKFEDEGQTFLCSIEAPRHAGMPPWWWFSLDSSPTTRYAPFEALPSDTQKSVQARIIAYYANLLVIKARPVIQKPHWTKPVRPPVVPPPDVTPVAGALTPQ